MSIKIDYEIVRSAIEKVKYTTIFEKEPKEHIVVKLQRAQGECLGTRSRRRTQQTAKSYGEP